MVSAQIPTDFTFAKNFGSTGTDMGNSITTDVDSNIIVTGQFKFTTDFGGQSLTSAGMQDIFIAKYSYDGTLQWVKQIGGVTNDQGKGVAVDASGNIYVTGNFTTTITIDGTVTLTNFGLNDAFLAKYNSNGIIQWAKAMGGSTDADFGESVAVSPSGDVVVTGYFTSTATFGTTQLTTYGQQDIFIAKYQSDGTFSWAKKAGSPSGDQGLDIACDFNNNIFITGVFSGTVKFDAISVTASGAVGFDVFLAKYNNAGDAIWAKKGISQSGAYEYGYGVAADRSGNIIICGYFKGGSSLSFGTTTLTNSGQWDAFVAKFDNDGVAVWAKKYGASQYDYAYDIATDFNNNVIIIGGYMSTVNFGVKSLTSVSSGTDDLFILKMDSTGSPLWVMGAGSNTTSNDWTCGNDVAIDRNGSVVATGWIEANPTFGTKALTSNGGDESDGEDIFISKIYQNVPMTGSLSVTATIDNVSCKGGNNGLINIVVANGTSPYTYLWSAGQTNSGISGLIAGTYTVTVTDGVGLTKVASFSVNEPTIITLTSSINGVKCFGDSNGSIDLTVTGGASSYTYAWSNATISEDIQNLLAGTYTVTVTDANSCTNTKDFSVNTPAQLEIIVDTIKRASNSTTCDGAIEISVTGGTLNYTYLWGNGKNTDDVTDLCTGNHSITVTDGNSCNVSKIIFVDNLTSTDEKSVNDNHFPFLISISTSGIILFPSGSNNLNDLKEINLYNIIGQKIADVSLNTSGISFYSLPFKNISGNLYLLEIKTSQGKTHHKIFAD
ncbi:MAG: hypothetical protein A3G23_05130 [Bacteroidetes bacterium RIFCSPLOWO2_12_FULL_37_12]|nr:MAG: hypothetical protein A3G23_05130 [Bacteroidetes bacterium RIFCSPLOWO2_12_FULL_37_12]